MTYCDARRYRRAWVCHRIGVIEPVVPTYAIQQNAAPDVATHSIVCSITRPGILTEGIPVLGCAITLIASLNRIRCKPEASLTP